MVGIIAYGDIAQHGVALQIVHCLKFFLQQACYVHLHKNFHRRRTACPSAGKIKGALQTS